VHRGGGRAVLTAFDAAAPVLRGGGLAAVYPEGTRSPDGRLYRGRTGAVRLARRAGVPIVPVGVLGTDRVD
jgi:1-acyl-sn-glycerol-3-phosphate acyltransferase